jgi:hypothetical protein
VAKKKTTTKKSTIPKAITPEMINYNVIPETKKEQIKTDFQLFYDINSASSKTTPFDETKERLFITSIHLFNDTAAAGNIGIENSTSSKFLFVLALSAVANGCAHMSVYYPIEIDSAFSVFVNSLTTGQMMIIGYKIPR